MIKEMIRLTEGMNSYELIGNWVVFVVIYGGIAYLIFMGFYALLYYLKWEIKRYKQKKINKKRRKDQTND